MRMIPNRQRLFALMNQMLPMYLERQILSACAVFTMQQAQLFLFLQREPLFYDRYLEFYQSLPSSLELKLAIFIANLAVKTVRGTNEADRLIVQGQLPQFLCHKRPRQTSFIVGNQQRKPVPNTSTVHSTNNNCAQLITYADTKSDNFMPSNPFSSV